MTAAVKEIPEHVVTEVSLEWLIQHITGSVDYQGRDGDVDTHYCKTCGGCKCSIQTPEKHHFQQRDWTEQGEWLDRFLDWLINTKGSDSQTLGLCYSLIDNGFTVPINLIPDAVRDGERTYTLGNGHHRLAAAVMSCVDVVKVWVNQGITWEETQDENEPQNNYGYIPYSEIEWVHNQMRERVVVPKTSEKEGEEMLGGYRAAGGYDGPASEVQNGVREVNEVANEDVLEQAERLTAEVADLREELARVRLERDNAAEGQAYLRRQHATFERTVREALAERVNGYQGWDRDEVNEVLRELDLEPLEQDWEVTLSVVYRITKIVKAVSADEAGEKAEEEYSNDDIAYDDPWEFDVYDVDPVD